MTLIESALIMIKIVGLVIWFLTLVVGLVVIPDSRPIRRYTRAVSLTLEKQGHQGLANFASNAIPITSVLLFFMIFGTVSLWAVQFFVAQTPEVLDHRDNAHVRSYCTLPNLK